MAHAALLSGIALANSGLGMAHGAGTVRIAQDEAERALLWKGRKNAFGAIARIKPNYYLHDTVVPRRRLPEVLKQVYEIVERHAHGYYIDRYPIGYDAAVFDPGSDFRWRNDTANPVFLWSWSDWTSITIDVWGIPASMSSDRSREPP